MQLFFSLSTTHTVNSVFSVVVWIYKILVIGLRPWGHKMRQNLVFLFLLPFIIYLSRFDLFSLSNFSKAPMMDILDIFSLGTPLKNYPSKHLSWSGRLQDVLIRTNIFALVIHLQKTSWSRPMYLSWSYLFQTFSRCLLAKTCSKHLQDVSKSFHQVTLFLLTRPQDVFETYSTRFSDILRRRICIGHTSEKFMVSVQNFQEWKEFLKF